MPLSPTQTQALQLLAAGKTNGQAAKAVGVRPETIGRWRKLPQFQDAMASANDPDLIDMDANVTHAKWAAFDTLMGLLQSDDPNIQLRAAAEIYKTWGTALPKYQGPHAEPKEVDADD
jgi:hypothetical protein